MVGIPQEATLVAAVLLLILLVAFPALAAWRRRRFGVAASAVATSLGVYAQAVRTASRIIPADEALLGALRRLGVPELAAFELAVSSPRATPELVASAAERLAGRLRRRIAFERKMLARTAHGRRRGAIAAAAPPLVLCAVALGGPGLPPFALAFVLALEVLGCWLLWRVARVAV